MQSATTRGSNWSDFLINSDTDFHASRAQINLLQQRTNQYLTTYCTTIVPELEAYVVEAGDKKKEKGRSKNREGNTDKDVMIESREGATPKKNRLVVSGASNGVIHVHQLSSTLKPKSYDPIFSFQAHKGPIYSLKWIQLPNQLLLISAADEEIRAWDWDLFDAHISNPQRDRLIPAQHHFQLQCDTQQGPRQLSMPRFETNALTFKDNYLFSGGGDGFIYQWDIVAERLVHKFSEPNDEKDNYVLSLNHTTSSLFSGHNDGLLRIWDVRSRTASRTMSPLTGENGNPTIKLQKPSWISAITIDEKTESWMVVGGGACYATLWYLPQMTITAVLPTSATINDICFTGDQIATVGNESNITFWEKNGRFRTRVKSDIPAIFSIANIPNVNEDAFVISGAAPNISVVLHDRVNTVLRL